MPYSSNNTFKRIGGQEMNTQQNNPNVTHTYCENCEEKLETEYEKEQGWCDSCNLPERSNRT